MWTFSRVDVPRDKATGMPLAYGFVEFANRADAWTAMQKVDGCRMDAGGRCVNVSWSNASKPPGPELMVDFLPLHIGPKAVRNLFTPFGTVDNVDLTHSMPSGAEWTCCFVSLLRAEDAARAIDELDGHVMEGTPIRVKWSMKSRPLGVHVRLNTLDLDVDRRVLQKLFERFAGIRRIEIQYNRLTGASLGFGHITFGTGEQAESAARAFGGRLLSRGEWSIDLPKAEIERELSRLGYDSVRTPASRFVPMKVAEIKKSQPTPDVLQHLEAASSASVRTIPTSVLTRASLANTTSPASPTRGSVLVDRVSDVPQCPPNEAVANAEGIGKRQRTTSSDVDALVSTAKTLLIAEQRKQCKVVRDLLTDRLISVPISSPEDAPNEAASEDLISFDEPQRSPAPALAEPPNEWVVIGPVRPAKAGRSITVRCFSALELEKQEKVTRILLNDACQPEDPNNNLNHAGMYKTTLVVNDLAELRAATDKLSKAGIDVFVCDDRSVRGGHSWHPPEGISVHVAEPPLADNIRYTQHIIFLRPSDDVADTLELLRTQKSGVTTVSVLYDEGSPSESARIADLARIGAP